eukprot:1716395-Rhodomonas_salina.2
MSSRCSEEKTTGIEQAKERVNHEGNREGGTDDRKSGRARGGLTGCRSPYTSALLALPSRAFAHAHTGAWQAKPRSISSGYCIAHS